MTSTRLPGKVLLKAAGRTMLDHHIERLTSADLPVIVATTTNATDDPVVEAMTTRGVPVWRGSETDVLSRYLGAIAAHGLDTVVRVTSDCPLIDGGVVVAALRTFAALDDPWVYLSNGQDRTYPRGMDFEIFSRQALEDAAARTTQPYQREHVTPLLYDGSSNKVRVHHVKRAVDKSMYRVTLDTEPDYRLIKALIEDYGAADLDCDGIIKVLDSHPELVVINSDVQQKQMT